MKRFLGILLALSLILGMSIMPASAEDITLTMALIGDGQQKSTIDNLLIKFTEQTGIKVETLYINSGWGEYCTKLQTMIAGGDQLDVAIVASEGIEMFVSMDIPTPIDDFIAANPEVSKTIQDDVSDDLEQAFIFGGNTYSFPFSFNNVFMHFNLDRIAQAGAEVPQGDWSKDDFIALCEKLTHEENGLKKYAVAVPYNEYFCMQGWLYNNGASYVSDDYTQATINAPESVEIFQLWQDLIYKYGYAPIPEVNVNAIQQLIDGQVAMGSWGRWPTTSYINSNFNNVAIQYLPNFSKNELIYGVDGFFVMKTSKYQDEAKQLVGWLSSAEFEGGYLGDGNVPVLQSLAAEKCSALGIPQNYELFYNDAVPMKQVSAPIAFSEVSSIVLRAMSEICVNQSDVQSTLDAAAEEINMALAG
jgi:multiple sugar transport system substrate-binding protein